jgi:hypothetical protein
MDVGTSSTSCGTLHTAQDDAVGITHVHPSPEHLTK